jgi:hypothetical protein
MRFQLLAAAAVLLSASLVAHADTDTDTDTNFSFTDVSVQGGGSITGYITIDTTTGTAVGSDFTIDSTIAGDATFDSAASAWGSQGRNNYLVEFNNNVFGDVISLMFDTGSLKGYTGGGLNNESNFLNSDYDEPSFTAVLTPESAVTPEPSSLVLLGTGLLGSIGAMRRKVLPQS